VRLGVGSISKLGSFLPLVNAGRGIESNPDSAIGAPQQLFMLRTILPSSFSMITEWRRQAQQLLRVRAQAFQDGVMWANVYNRYEGREAAVLYCAPSKIVLQGEQLIDILRREVEARPELAHRPRCSLPRAPQRSGLLADRCVHLTVQACMDAHESASLRRESAVGRFVRCRGRAGKPEIIRVRIDHQPCRGKPRRHQHGQEMSGRRPG